MKNSSIKWVESIIQINYISASKRKLSEIEGKIVGKKWNLSFQTNRINILSLEIHFSIQSFETKIQFGAKNSHMS